MSSFLSSAVVQFVSSSGRGWGATQSSTPGSWARSSALWKSLQDSGRKLVGGSKNSTQTEATNGEAPNMCTTGGTGNSVGVNSSAMRRQLFLIYSGAQKGRQLCPLWRVKADYAFWLSTNPHCILVFIPYYLPTFSVLINEYVAGHVKGLCFPFLSSQAYSCQCGIFQHLLYCKPITRGKARLGSQAFADSWLR